METTKKIRILHLEDEILISDMVGLRLKTAGIRAEIDRVCDKEKFLQKEFLQKKPPQTSLDHGYDIFLLDYQLPDFDGITALRLIREHDPDTPVIMVSGALDEDSIITSLRLGATDYVMKNNMERLVPAVIRALDERARTITHQDTLADLQEAQIRLTDLAANLPGGLYQFLRRADGSYAIPWCSEGFEKISGVNAYQIKDNAQPAFARIAEDDRPNILASIEHSAAHLKKWEQTFRLKTDNGTPCWLQAISQPRKLNNGSIIWNGLILDITAQKHQEQELFHYRDHLQELVDERTEVVRQQAQIIDQIYDAVLSVDKTGRITSWNKGAERIFGYQRDEALGQPMSVLCLKETDEIACKELQTVIQEQSALESELKLVRKNKDSFSAYISLSPLKESNGEVIGVIAYAMDISNSKQAESALQNSEAKYRAVVETAVDGIITIDKRGVIETYNKAAEHIFGYSAAQAIGKSITMLMPQSYAEHHQDYIENYLYNGTQKVIGTQREVSGMHMDGIIFPLQLSVSEMRIDGESKFTGIVRNIAQIKQTEKALLRSERFSRNILNSLSDHIAVLDKYGNIRQVNDAWEEFAVSNQTGAGHVGIGCNYLTICQRAMEYPEDFASRAYQGIKAVLEQSTSIFTMEYPCHAPHQQRWFLMSVVPLLGDAGGAVVAHMNISERVMTEHALQESEQRLKEAQRIACIGNWQWHTGDGTLEWSEEIFRIFGRDPHDFHPTYEQFLSLIHPDDLQRINLSEQQAFSEGKPYSIDHRIVLPDGGLRWVHEEAIAVLDENGNPLKLTGTMQDITERKEIENQLIIAKNEAEKASRTKSEFLSSMSHELRTPLNAILGYTQLMLMDEMFSEDQLTSLGEINKAGEHLLHLISDLLDLAKIEAGRMQLNTEQLPLWEIIEECHHLVLPTAQRRNITIHCSGNQHSGVAVHADRIRLKQVVLNLVSNAVKYNRDNGKINIEVQTLDDVVRVSVQDTGKGIEPQHLNKLFQAFSRLGAESSAIEGTGIGLYIAKTLIELMQGRIQVESTPGEGTTFLIEIPSSEQSGMAECRQLKTSVDGNKHSQADSSQHTILYIEDNPANLRLVKHVLRFRPGIKLLTAITGAEGLEIASLEIPDLVLLDISLPGMDGYEVLANLQNNELTQHIPVIAVSANAMTGDIEQGLSAGFIDYITKPIDINKLLHAIDQTMGHKLGAA
ncbi:MAG: PAS domain S-box protein [Gammaproteobacteria bacterium]|nr:PAS domain S-box protein [Gammaproteobacteria bacterium]